VGGLGPASHVRADGLGCIRPGPDPAAARASLGQPGALQTLTAQSGGGDNPTRGSAGASASVEANVPADLQPRENSASEHLRGVDARPGEHLRPGRSRRTGHQVRAAPEALDAGHDKTIDLGTGCHSVFLDQLRPSRTVAREALGVVKQPRLPQKLGSDPWPG